MMTPFIVSLFFIAVSVIASSQDEKQALLLRYIQAGDLERVKALVCPFGVDMSYDEETSDDSDSFEEVQPLKKIKLCADRHPANLNNNEALYTAFEPTKAEIVEYLLTLPEVLRSIQQPSENARKFVLFAVSYGYDNFALEYLQYCEPDYLIYIFDLFPCAKRPSIFEKLLSDDRLDLKPLTDHVFRFIDSFRFHRDTVSHEDRQSVQKLAFLLASHKKLLSVDFNRNNVIYWAAINNCPSVFALSLKGPNLRFSSFYIYAVLKNFDGNLHESGNLYGTILLSHPSISAGNWDKSTTSKLLRLKHSFKMATIEELRSERNGKWNVTKKREYMALVCQACYDKDFAKLAFMLESYPDFTEFNQMGNLSNLSMVMAFSGETEVSLFVMNLFEKYFLSDFASLNFSVNCLIIQKEHHVLEQVFFRLCNSFPEIVNIKQKIEEFLYQEIEPGSIQGVFELLIGCTEVVKDLETKGFPDLSKLLQFFFPYSALRLAFAEIDLILPLEILSQIFHHMLDNLI